MRIFECISNKYNYFSGQEKEPSYHLLNTKRYFSKLDNEDTASYRESAVDSIAERSLHQQISSHKDYLTVT